LRVNFHILVLTADVNDDTKRPALRAGATDFDSPEFGLVYYLGFSSGLEVPAGAAAFGTPDTFLPESEYGL
jgi:hypothetical protein